jgi:Helix-turn-helix domain
MATLYPSIYLSQFRSLRAESSSMPQMQLPIFPDGVEHINAQLAYEKGNGQVTYFNGCMPVFIHDEKDVATFRMITAQFCINGNATQAEISRAFGVTLISVKRAVKRYRQKGVAGFYQEPNRRGPAVLTAEVLQEAQRLLDGGCRHRQLQNNWA